MIVIDGSTHRNPPSIGGVSDRVANQTMHRQEYLVSICSNDRESGRQVEDQVDALVSGLLRVVGLELLHERPEFDTVTWTDQNEPASISENEEHVGYRVIQAARLIVD